MINNNGFSYGLKLDFIAVFFVKPFSSLLSYVQYSTNRMTILINSTLFCLLQVRAQLAIAVSRSERHASSPLADGLVPEALPQVFPLYDHQLAPGNQPVGRGVRNFGFLIYIRQRKKNVIISVQCHV